MNFRNVTRNILEALNDDSTIGRRENTEIDDSDVFRKTEKFTDSVTNGQYSELGDKLHTLKCTVDETSEYNSSLENPFSYHENTIETLGMLLPERYSIEKSNSLLFKKVSKYVYAYISSSYDECNYLRNILGLDRYLGYEINGVFIDQFDIKKTINDIISHTTSKGYIDDKPIKPLTAEYNPNIENLWNVNRNTVDCMKLYNYWMFSDEGKEMIILGLYDGSSTLTKMEEDNIHEVFNSNTLTVKLVYLKDRRSPMDYKIRTIFNPITEYSMDRASNITCDDCSEISFGTPLNECFLMTFSTADIYSYECHYDSHGYSNIIDFVNGMNKTPCAIKRYFKYHPELNPNSYHIRLYDYGRPLEYAPSYNFTCATCPFNK